MRSITRPLAPYALLLALLVPAQGAAAAAVERERFLFEETVINTCNGEIVELLGTYQIVTKQDADSFIQNFTLHLEGTGDQGNSYHLNENAQNRVFQAPNFSSASFDKARLISKGSAPDQIVTVYINSRGENSVETVCRG